MTGKRFCLQYDDGTELVYGCQDMLLAVGVVTKVGKEAPAFRVDGWRRLTGW
jgi:hypothetical protein